jgi:hypothetical protein
MDDMHYENLVYEKDGHGSYRVVMIDADNAISRRIFGHLKGAREHGGGFGGDSDLVGVTGITKDFLKTNVKSAFNDQHVVCRTVPLMTQSLSAMRGGLNRVLKTEEQFDSLIALINAGGPMLDNIFRLFGTDRDGLPNEAQKLQLDRDQDALAKIVIAGLPGDSTPAVDAIKEVLRTIALYYGWLTNGLSGTAGLHGLVSPDGARRPWFISKRR